MTWQPGFVVAWVQFAAAAAVLLGVGVLIARRISEPAERARAVLVTLSAVLGVPLVMLTAPLPTWNLGLVSLATAESHFPASAPPTSALAERTSRGKSDVLRTDRPAEPALRPGEDATPGLAPVADDALKSQPQLARTAATPPLLMSRLWSIAFWALLGVHALAIALFVAVRLLGALQVRRLCRGALAASENVSRAWNALTGDAGRNVRLLLSDEVAAPLVFGWRRPTVIVPQTVAAAGGPAPRYCLAHEWSHIQRHDVLSWTFAQLAGWLLWYQPGYWALRRELRLSQEFLADHRSANIEQDPLEYSELLLHLAQQRRAAPVAGALNLLDQPSQLGRRVRMLIERRVLRGHCRRPFTCAAIVLAVSLTATISMVRVAASQAEEESPAKSGQKAAAATKAPAEKTAESPVSEPKNTVIPPATEVPKNAAAEVIPAIDAPPPATAEAPAPGKTPGELNYTGLVVDKTNGKPIRGATVTVHRENLRPNGEHYEVEATKHTTDAAGFYQFTIPPEQASQPRLYIELDVEHPDYAARSGFGYSLAMIRKNLLLGEQPFFAKIELWPGDHAIGRVLSPEGEPLAGIAVKGYSKANAKDFREYGSFTETVTGHDGTFRLPLVKGGVGVVWVIPREYASLQKVVHEDRNALGDIRLEKGIRIHGRALDAAGNPLAKMVINIERRNKNETAEDQEFNQLNVFSSIRRGTLTDAEGKFELEPLPAGDYQFTPRERVGDPLVKNSPERELPDVFLTRKFTITDQETLEPLELQAVPHVLFEAQFHNSKGDKCNGHDVNLFGQLNGEYWFGRAESTNGHVSLRVPHGLTNTQVDLITNEHSALRWRRGQDGELKPENDRVMLGTMNDDVLDFEIVRYVAPIVLVQAVDEQGEKIEKYRVTAAYPWGQQRYILEGEERSDLSFEHQNDGRYRTSQMLPDEEVTFTAKADGFEPASEKVSVPEGEKRELVLTLKKKAAESPAADTAATEPK